MVRFKRAFDIISDLLKYSYSLNFAVSSFVLTYIRDVYPA